MALNLNKIRMLGKRLDSSPDDTREFEKGKVEIVNFSNMTIGRALFEPGWN
jgi:hypothetical protein